MPVAIEAHHISKQFFLGERNQRTFFEDMWSNTIVGARRFLQPGRASLAEPSRPSFWALHDVSFQLHQGETLAIIGENGAGKSTLLKILSRITQPTMGKAKVFGRLASLLEVGAGFHPEFSGRDNIYLNGTCWVSPRKRSARSSTRSLISPGWKNSSMYRLKTIPAGCTSVWPFP